MLQLDFQRYECKYLIPEDLHDDVVEYVSCFTRPDVFTAQGDRQRYFIRSLYLDTPQLLFHHARSHRALNRMKLRIRTYGENGDGPVFLEIKRKIKDVIFKRRVRVSGHDWFRHRENGAPYLFRNDNERDRAVGEEFVSLMEKYAAQPAMLVHYSREAHESLIDDYARVTFDRQIRCRMPEHFTLSNLHGGWMPVDHPMNMGLSCSGTVLELKFANHPPYWLVDLVRRFGLQRRGFSKYSNSVARGMGCYWPEEGARQVLPSF